MAECRHDDPSHLLIIVFPDLDVLCTIVYNTGVVRVVRSTTFIRWVRGLRDGRARVRINARLRRVELTGNLGDVKAVGGSVFEMRVNYGPGYRLYFIREGAEVVVLLCGGDKSGQRRDIVRAKTMAADRRS